MIDLLGYEQFSNGCCMYVYGRHLITTLYKQLVEIKSMNFVLALLKLLLHSSNRVPASSRNNGKPGKLRKTVPCMEKSWNLRKPE